MTMPNLLIIGTQKAGTTAVYSYLKQHPQVFMSPVKEPHFFAFAGEKVNYNGPRDQEVLDAMIKTDVTEYHSLFHGVSTEVAIGEASAMYLYYPGVCERIRSHIPDVKLIAILRNPVDRAYSAFMQLRRDGREPLSDFTQALQEEDKRIRFNWAPIWHYKKMGFYYEQLRRYFDTFEPDQIKVYLHEDLNGNVAGTLRDIFRFLRVDDTFSPDVSTRHNVSGIPRNRTISFLLTLLTKRHPIKTFLINPILPERLRQRIAMPIVSYLQFRHTVKPQLSARVRQQLLQDFREDILKLQDLLNRDLSVWLR